MVYVAGTNTDRASRPSEAAYPSVAYSLPSASANVYSSSSVSSYYGSSSPQSSGWKSGTLGNNFNGTLNGCLSPSTNLGLRKRDGVAILTCLFLLRLAFTPSDTAVTSSGGLVNFADSSISASMELAFYSPFQSHPPRMKSDETKSRRRGEVGERTARPVPLDIDGDGVVEAMVVPVFMKREQVLKEKEMDMLEKPKGIIASKFGNIQVDEAELNGWEETGSWGLRVLNLKPLHHRDADEKEGVIAGPFAPRSMFLSPLLLQSTKQSLDDKSAKNNNSKAYPIKLLSMQIPIQRTQLGEEEKSRQRHKKSNEGSSGIYGTGSGPPPKNDPKHKDYDRTRHYFCGRDWHHASQSCHKHCGGGVASECGEGEGCYADTPCDAFLAGEGDTSSKDFDSNEGQTEMALTPRGTLPGITTVWSDGSVSLHVITADVNASEEGTSKQEHRGKRTRYKHKRPELELRQLWRVYPLNQNAVNTKTQGDNVVNFDELGLTFESSEIFGAATAGSDKVGGEATNIKAGAHGAVIMGGRYVLTSPDGKQHPLKMSFHALDALSGASLWELEGFTGAAKDSTNNSQKNKDFPAIPIIHTTSSARRRSHLPTEDTLDPDFDNDNAFIEGDLSSSEECISHFRSSVLDEESGALPHEYWDDGEYGSISVGRFERNKKSSGGKRTKPFGKKPNPLSTASGVLGGGARAGTTNAGSSATARQMKRSSDVVGSGGIAGGKSWQSDLFHRSVPQRLISQQRYNAFHPRSGKPNVIIFHGRDGLAVLSLKNGRPVCHISLMDHALYADLDKDGIIDMVQVVTSPEALSKSGGIQSLIERVTKSDNDNDEGRKTRERRTKLDAPVVCHALVTSGLPPREEVFTAPLCLGGPLMSIDPKRPQAGLSAAPPLLVEGSLGYGNDVVFAMNNGVVVRYDSNGREVWRKGGLKDGTPSWKASSNAFLGRIEFGAVKSHSSVSASSHRNQHRPGSPVRPILLSGEDGAALISSASGNVLSSVVYPQSVVAQPMLSDLNGDGTDDLLVVSADGIWGYRVVVQTGRSGFFSIMVVTIVVGVALAALVHKTSNSSQRSMDDY